MNTIINLLDTYAGPVFALSFFTIMGYIFYWIIVIAPRKIKGMFSELQKRGYQIIEADDVSLKDDISQLAAVYPVRPRKDQEEIPPWNIRNAIRRIDQHATRIIAHVSRLQIDQPGVKHNATSRVTILFIEKRKLDIVGDIHITPKKNPGDNLWKKRYKASLVTEVYKQNFLDLYNIYSQDNTMSLLPEDLCNTLIEVCPTVCQKELFCFQGGINFRFSPEGWGISPANIIYKKSEFTMILDIFNRISGALPLK